MREHAARAAEMMLVMISIEEICGRVLWVLDSYVGAIGIDEGGVGLLKSIFLGWCNERRSRRGNKEAI